MIQVKVIAYSRLMVPQVQHPAVLLYRKISLLELHVFIRWPAAKYYLIRWGYSQILHKSYYFCLHAFFSPIGFFQVTLSSFYTILAGCPECIPRDVWILGQFPRSMKLWSTHISILTLPNQSRRLPVDHLNSNPRRCLWQKRYLINKFVWGTISLGVLHMNLEGLLLKKKWVGTSCFWLETRQAERLAETESQKVW